jgi:hypothetical protein
MRIPMPTHPKTDTPTSDPHEPIARLQLRAALFAAPDTLVTAKEFARAMGVRRLSASQSPPTARPIGGSVRAPFRDWLEVIGAASTSKRHRGSP